MQSINAKVRLLQTLGRVEHFDSEGGGRIARVLYCEPYTAHKRVCTALKGTVYDTGGGTWGRHYPHADPLYPWFYCQDVQVEPAFPAAARAARNMLFRNAGNELADIQTALDTVDDYDGAELVDNLGLAEIAAGKQAEINLGDTQTVNTGEQFDIGTFNSRGACGAKITATYLPLLFQPGVLEAQRFDFVDPQWEPLTWTTQTGRSLKFYSPSNGWFSPTLHGGLSDAFALPEVVWRFSIRRLMVPFLPQIAIGKLANKVNQSEFHLGNLRVPAGCVRMETPEVITRRAPDGNIYFDITLKFLVRKLWDEYYDPLVGAWPAAGGWRTGWVGWNWAFGMPSANWTELVHDYLAGYYPVKWSSVPGGLGGIHSLFLSDSDVGLLLDFHPFSKGFQVGD